MRKSRPSSSPVRLRQEPATVAEAVAAAQALTPDLEQQVDIDGQDVVVGVQRHPDGRNGAGPQPRNGE